VESRLAPIRLMQSEASAGSELGVEALLEAGGARQVARRARAPSSAGYGGEDERAGLERGRLRRPHPLLAARPLQTRSPRGAARRPW
jgi:hypothetical protein